MSLLLLLRAQDGITGSVTTSQAQSVTANGTVTDPAITGSITSSQAQTTTASGSNTAPVSGTVTSSQAQTTSASGSFTPAAISGSVSSSQAQTVNASGTFIAAGISGTASNSQAQSISASGTYTPAPISGTVAASQAQATNASGSFNSGIVGTVTSSQAQTTLANGTVVNPVNEQQFGARDDAQDREGAEKLARKTISDRNKRDAEIKSLLVQVQAQQEAQLAVERTQSTPNEFKTQSNSKRKAKVEFKLQKQPVIAELTQIPELITNDDFDMDLIMAMLAIE